jgi:hypothetical protein
MGDDAEGDAKDTGESRVVGDNSRMVGATGFVPGQVTSQGGTGGRV